jgi:hypothetical protein
MSSSRSSRSPSARLSTPRVAVASVALCVLALALCGASCAPPPPPPEELTPIDCELGLWTEDVPFAAIADDGETPAEMIFGFQGFLWVDVALRCPTPGPATGAVALAVTTEDDRTFSASLPRVELDEVDGVRLSEPIQVRLDNGEGPSALEGLHAEVSLRLEGDGYEATAIAGMLLVDEDDCIDTDEEPICPDAGPADAGDRDAGAEDGGDDPDAGAQDAGAVDAGPGDGGGA